MYRVLLGQNLEIACLGSIFHQCISLSLFFGGSKGLYSLGKDLPDFIELKFKKGQAK